jgi:hypothetical protein
LTGTKRIEGRVTASQIASAQGQNRLGFGEVVNQIPVAVPGEAALVGQFFGGNVGRFEIFAHTGFGYRGMTLGRSARATRSKFALT